MNFRCRDNFAVVEDIFPPSVFAGFIKESSYFSSAELFERLMNSYLNIDIQEVVYLKQIHSSVVHRYVSEGGYLEGDGVFTHKNNVLLFVQTADCMPIFFSSRKGDWVGVVHMGWRSAEAGILDILGFDLADFIVVAGVGLRKCCYRVGEEFLRFVSIGKFVYRINDKLFFDPIEFIRRKLKMNGLKEDNFYDMNICSCCDLQGYPSYRREKTFVRTISFILKLW